MDSISFNLARPGIDDQRDWRDSGVVNSKEVFGAMNSISPIVSAVA